MSRRTVLTLRISLRVRGGVGSLLVEGAQRGERTNGFTDRKRFALRTQDAERADRVAQKTARGINQIPEAFFGHW